MKIYKFGGASVNSAEGVRNLQKIVGKEKGNLVIVVSAMGKITNALEKVVNSFFERRADVTKNLQAVIDFHTTIVDELFEDKTTITAELKQLYDELKEIIQQKPSLSYDYDYDRIVSFGELISTTIVANFLEQENSAIQFVDIRAGIKTDDNYREGNVDMDLSQKLCDHLFAEREKKVFVTQGFIAGTITNQTTTLGREGSDYTAAILANLLNADSVTIWKDVPGVMTADPKRYKEVQIIPKLSYKEAIELSYCGASIIHPKTVKPLQNKKIPLFVKSFIEPDKDGSVINEYPYKLNLPPIYIDKSNQVLLTLTPRDFSFIAEEKLSKIFSVLASYRLKVSLMQTSAISFSFCMDYNKVNFQQLVQEFKNEFEVLYNTDVELISIRHHTKEIIDKLVGEKIVFVEQRNRLTARFVVSE
ncbi:MAG: aspartate kinase [Paludibacteraceae bacterium]|jgi:aspartate kinase|nr:aspartate kinase [Paludibacteraceae bacterium]HHT60543.1 aspartate kinase [Bacteroidales bacterium]HOA46616.1 aspartate kinase [Paludibacteraceae bacterium]HOH70570.1 aspartate kinase [Paludibacteraceae bacterium]HPH72569.1 aspartate kinase [Paludibacteraceae bacterium]